MNSEQTTVVVTGGSGYIGTHIIEQLLSQGFRVVATVRSTDAEERVRQSLRNSNTSFLSFVHAELTSDEGWDDAVRGATYVIHTASPFPPTQPENPLELVTPARDGAQRVLMAAERAGVKRVVLTSSFAAVGYSRNNFEVPFTEEDWTEPTDDLTPYVQSKTVAEQLAWGFVDKTEVHVELSVINPVAVIGPVHGRDFASSIGMVLMLTTGMMPGNPKLSFGIVDVRDVADLHIRAMLHPDAAGKRFLAVAQSPVWVQEMAEILRRLTPEYAAKVPKRQLPTWLVRLAAKRQPALASFTSELGKAKLISNAQAKEVLGWEPRSIEESLVDTVRSLAAVGVISAQ